MSFEAKASSAKASKCIPFSALPRSASCLGDLCHFYFCASLRQMWGLAEESQGLAKLAVLAFCFSLVRGKAVKVCGEGEGVGWWENSADT